MKKKKSSVLGCLVVVLTAILFVCCLVVGVGVGLAPGYLAGFNVRTDPFGVLEIGSYSGGPIMKLKIPR